MSGLLKSTLASVMLILSLSVLVSAMSKPKSENVKFQSNPVCGMCKNRIETTLQKIDGVLVSLVNLNNGKISVKFDPEVTNAEAIKNQVLNMGYAVNGTAPNAEAVEKLPDCCKSGAKH